MGCNASKRRRRRGVCQKCLKKKNSQYKISRKSVVRPGVATRSYTRQTDRQTDRETDKNHFCKIFIANDKMCSKHSVLQLSMWAAYRNTHLFRTNLVAKSCIRTNGCEAQSRPAWSLPRLHDNRSVSHPLGPPLKGMSFIFLE